MDLLFEHYRLNAWIMRLHTEPTAESKVWRTVLTSFLRPR
jgi:hypothetical protein